MMVRLYEIRTPDGRSIRQLRDLTKDRLLEGYSIVGEVFGADSEKRGGYVQSLVPHVDGVGRSFRDLIIEIIQKDALTIADIVNNVGKRRRE